MSAERDIELSEAIDPLRWVERYGDVLFRYARSRVQDRTVAEDLVQETFLAALQTRDHFAGRSSEQTWLIGILRRKIADHYRKAARRPATEGAETASAKQFDHRGHWISRPKKWQLDPARIAENVEFWSVFDDCVSKLPRRLGDSFRLRESEDVTTEEICQVLGISSSNLWTQLYRARVFLRRCLEANWFDRGN